MNIIELEKGFINRYFAQISLPHSKIDASTFKRSSGCFTLDIFADPEIGLPYGTYPRLLLAWICTEATKSQSAELHLGSNQSDFLRKLDISRQGSTIASLKDQINRLLNSLFRITIKGDNSNARKNLLIADKTFEFWETHNGNWETHLILNKNFWEELLAHPVPINLNVLHAVRKSPMTMDVYTWVTYRTYLIYTHGGRAIHISWRDLQAQFGASFGQNLDESVLNPSEIIKKEAHALRNFRARFLTSLNSLARFYPELNQIIRSDSEFLSLRGAKLIPHK